MQSLLLLPPALSACASPRPLAVRVAEPTGLDLLTTGLYSPSALSALQRSSARLALSRDVGSRRLPSSCCCHCCALSFCRRLCSCCSSVEWGGGGGVDPGRDRPGSEQEGRTMGGRGCHRRAGHRQQVSAARKHGGGMRRVEIRRLTRLRVAAVGSVCGCCCRWMEGRVVQIDTKKGYYINYLGQTARAATTATSIRRLRERLQHPPAARATRARNADGSLLLLVCAILSGWSEKWNEWVPLKSNRIAPSDTLARAAHKRRRIALDASRSQGRANDACLILCLCRAVLLSPVIALTRRSPPPLRRTAALTSWRATTC